MGQQRRELQLIGICTCHVQMPVMHITRPKVLVWTYPNRQTIQGVALTLNYQVQVHVLVHVQVQVLQPNTIQVYVHVPLPAGTCMIMLEH